MKKQILFYLIALFSVTAFSQTINHKVDVKLDTVSLGSKQDSLLVRGVDKKIKTISKSNYLSDYAKQIWVTNQGYDTKDLNEVYGNFGATASYILVDNLEGQTGYNPTYRGLSYVLDHATEGGSAKYFQIFNKDSIQPTFSVGQLGVNIGGVVPEIDSYVSITNKFGNNKRAFFINQLATEEGSDGLRVYSRSLKEPAAYFRQWDGTVGGIWAETQICHWESGIASNWFFRDVDDTISKSPLSWFHQANSSDDQPVMTLTQDGLGFMVESSKFRVLKDGKLNVRDGAGAWFHPLFSEQSNYTSLITAENKGGNANVSILAADTHLSKFIFGSVSNENIASIDSYYNSDNPFLRFKIKDILKFKITNTGVEASGTVQATGFKTATGTGTKLFLDNATTKDVSDFATATKVDEYANSHTLVSTDSYINNPYGNDLVLTVNSNLPADKVYFLSATGNKITVTAGAGVTVTVVENGLNSVSEVQTQRSGKLIAVSSTYYILIKH